LIVVLFENGLLVIALVFLLLRSVHIIVDESLPLEEVLAALLLLNEFLGLPLLFLLLLNDHTFL